MPEELPRAAIGLVGVSKRFGSHAAVDDVSLEIAEGEFFSLLGPSGCGKTTTLRMVAGDEPLGALDVKLRKQMQLELKRIQSTLGTTFVYVTHDQEEALAMSDRIAVMNGGRVEQIGSPREIYERPLTAFVADFIGSLNALDLRIDELVGENAVMRLGEVERIVVPVGGGRRAGETVRVAVRPERVQLGP